MANSWTNVKNASSLNDDDLMALFQKYQQPTSSSLVSTIPASAAAPAPIPQAQTGNASTPKMAPPKRVVPRSTVPAIDDQAESDSAQASQGLGQIQAQSQVSPGTNGIPPQIAATPVARGSGLTEKVGADTTKKDENKTTSTTWADPTQLASAYNALAGDHSTEESAKQYPGIPAFVEQARGIDDLNNLLKIGAQNPVQTDLSPLMSFVDAQTGSHFIQGYKHPETGDDKFRAIMNYADKVQDDKRDLFKTVLDGIKAQKTGTLITSVGDIAKLAQAATAEDPRKFDAKGGGGKPFDPDKDVQKLQARISNITALNDRYNNIVSALKDAGIDPATWNGKGFIPGGGVESHFPDFFLGVMNGGKGLAVKQALADFLNYEATDNFGKRITVPEVQRLQRSLGTGSTAPALAQGLQRVGPLIQKEMQKIQAGYGVHKEVLPAYAENGGTLAKDVTPVQFKYLQDQKNAAGAKAAQKAALQKQLDDNQKKLDALLKKSQGK